MLKKVIFILFSLIGNAHAIDYIKTCDIASKYVSDYYPIYYDYYIGLYSDTMANSKERIRGIEFSQEKTEIILDDISKQMNSLDSTDKFAVNAIYKFSFYSMDKLAGNDAGNKKVKQSKERIQRIIFTDCVRK
jgi:hypothetical protein